jgi:thymidylate synthase
VPFNIASYSFLTHILCKLCGLVPHEFVHFIGDAHIYTEHLNACKDLLRRETFPFPSLQIRDGRYEKIEDFQVDDFIVVDYVSNNAIRAKMIA